MKQTRQEIPHLNQSILIKCKYYGAQDNRGACFYLSTNDLRPFCGDKTKKVKFSYSYEYDSACSDAFRHLINSGLEVLTINTNDKNEDVFICKWNDESFQKLAKLFNVKLEN